MFVAFVGTAALTGCQNEEIGRYTVPKPPTVAEPEAKVRLLAVIVPSKTKTWFFKFTGATPLVKEHEADFRKLVQSVRLDDNSEEKPITWTLPEGWSFERSTRPLRYGTFTIGKGDKAPEVLLSALGREFGSELDNVNRWRKEIGLKPATQAELPKMIKVDEVGGVRVVFVDLNGPGGTGGMGMGR